MFTAPSMCGKRSRDDQTSGASAASECILDFLRAYEILIEHKPKIARVAKRLLAVRQIEKAEFAQLVA
jgi:hypothetical protein